MTGLDQALAAVLDPLVDAAVRRIAHELEASMRHIKPLAVPSAEAGRLLGVSETTVRRLIRAGELPTIPHVGDRVLVPVASLEAWVEQAATSARSHAPPQAAKAS